MHIRFGESVSEVCSENDRGKRRMGLSTNDHAIRDMVLQVPCQGSIEVGSTGLCVGLYRYLNYNPCLDRGFWRIFAEIN